MPNEANDTPIKSKNTGTVSIRPSAATQEKLIKYVQGASSSLVNAFNMRDTFLQKDLAYSRERGRTKEGFRAAWANSVGDSGKIRDVTIPIVMPQVETGTASLTETFLSSYPIFPVLSKPQKSPEAIQMETLVGEHSIKFQWVPELMMCFRDALKYNIAAAEVCWETRKSWTIETDTSSAAAAGKAVETYYEGNYVKHMDMYNMILDLRIKDLSQHHIKGEYVGYVELLTRIQLVQKIADLGATSTLNATQAYESGGAVWGSSSNTAGYYIPEINPYNFDKPNSGAQQNPGTFDWSIWAGEAAKDGIKYSNTYEVITLYCRIIPNDFDMAVASRNTVQIWKLTVVNRKVIIQCERQTNAHNYLPIIIFQAMEDGLGLQTKSFADNVLPMQDAATAMWTAAIESQRRKVFDRIFYDPSKINKKDIDPANAVARIPVKQVAYGQDLRSAIHVEPYRDEGVPQLLQMAQEMAGFADTVAGQNKVQQGQFQKGNKSRKEFETVMGNATSRQDLMTLLVEFRFMQPIKEIIKLNILQFQPQTTLYNRNVQGQIKIDPTAIRNAALEFQLADGVLSAGKMINLDALGEILQMTAANPALAQQYDIPGMMIYVLQLQGAAWVQDFRRDPQQQVAVGQNIQAQSGATDAAGNPIQPTAIPESASTQPTQ